MQMNIKEFALNMKLEKLKTGGYLAEYFQFVTLKSYLQLHAFLMSIEKMDLSECLTILQFIS